MFDSTSRPPRRLEATIKTIHFCYLKAHEILWKLGYWRYLLVPMTLSALLLPVMLVAFLLFYAAIASFLEKHIPGMTEYPFLGVLVLVVAFIFGMAGPFFVLYRSLVMLCYSPFLGRLSVEAERSVKGEVKIARARLAESVRRALLVSLGATLLSLAAVILGLILNLVPVLGAILFILAIPPIQMFLSSLAYVDPYLARNGFGAAASLKLMLRNVAPMTLFGAIGFGIMLIPIVGWFVGPTYSVVAGIVFGMVIMDERKPTTVGGASRSCRR